VTLPTFPDFKPLALEDQPHLTALVERFPPYSDFDFASLWSWNGAEQAKWCRHRENLLLLIADYTTREPILTMIGAENVNATADLALVFAEEQRHPASVLKLVPETTALLLDPTRFSLQSDPDHHDYVYDVADHLEFRGGVLKAHRGALARFRRTYPGYDTVVLAAGESGTQGELLALWERWEDSVADSATAEKEAFRRFVSVAYQFSCIATGIAVENSLVAFDITVLNGSGWGNSLFAKADRRFTGIYSVLQHEVSKRLLQAGCHCINFEQDLGIPGLRRAKRGFGPRRYLRKFSVGRNRAR
jgi:hypothetical protein